MDLKQAESYLLDLELFGMRFGLDRMHKLMTALGMPQRRFASIHVVGSNGKSSTTRMIAAILERHGLRAGAYTSPHLVSFAERVEVGGRPIGDAEFAAAVARVAQAARLVNRTSDEPVTQFEALTAAAYHALAVARVEVAVVEAGLGGRYDATNVIPSKVQVLTGVGLEHTRWLGPTLTDIAGEKLAVVPPGGRLVTGELEPEAEAVAAAVNARRVRVSEPWAGPLRALGSFQRRNFALAVAAAEAFLGELDPAAVERAATEVEIPGRLQQVGDAPLTLYDGAHNPDGARALAAALPEVLDGRPLTAVLAILDDKDAASMLEALLPLCSRLVLTRCSNPRSLPPPTLEQLAMKVSGAGAGGSSASALQEGASGPEGGSALQGGPSRPEGASALQGGVSGPEGGSALQGGASGPEGGSALQGGPPRAGGGSAFPEGASEAPEGNAEPPTETIADPIAALERARQLAGPDGAVLVTGSIYLVADLVRGRTAARASTL